MSDLACSFHPWPEDKPPEGSLPCADCALARPGSRIVWGEGNPKAKVWILLDNPGLREDRGGEPFVCGTRQTLHATAADFGYSADTLYVTYVVRRRPIGKYPKDVERGTCIANFHTQVSQNHPDVIFCMGDVALSSLLGQEAHIKDMRGRHHRWRDLALFVTYHPLAVRRRPNLMPAWRADWGLLHASVTPGGERQPL